MKILVTGANGFIGKHVVKALHVAGHSVVTLDMPWYAFMDMPADITKPLPKVGQLDAVIHLAAMAHPTKCDKDPSGAFAANVHGTSNVLRMALESGARKFVFPSSAHVYSIPPLYFPSDEEHPLRLNNTYTTTKVLGEQLCDLYWTNHGLSYTVLRLFNVYGPGQALGYFIPDMISKAKAGPIELKGSGTTKDWVHIDDVVRAFCLAIETPFVGALNIGTGIETDLGTIASRIARINGVSYLGIPTEQDTRMCADAGRAHRVLGWSPTSYIKEELDALCYRVKV